MTDNYPILYKSSGIMYLVTQ